MEELLKRFEAVYDLLYSAGSLLNYDEALDRFDEGMKSKQFRGVLDRFNRYRGDLVTSDREVAAFVIAYYYE